MRSPLTLAIRFIRVKLLISLFNFILHSAKFVEKLEADRNGLSPTSKMKLLNLNGYAKYLACDYKGPLLPEDSGVFRVPLAHSKSKQILINGMLDALKSLLPASNHLKSLHDSKMGFLIGQLLFLNCAQIVISNTILYFVQITFQTPFAYLTIKGIHYL